MMDLDISIVVPLFNESGNITVLVEQITANVRPCPVSFELVLVDDGSADATWQEVEAVAKQYSEVKGIRLSRNFGHQNALLAGFHEAKGKAIISMDGDLQHPPETLPELIRHWSEGKKIVHTKKRKQEHLSAFKRKTSDWFYSVFSWLSGVKLEAGNSDFRLIDRQVLTEVLRFNDVNPFLRGAVRWLGFDSESTTVAYDLGKRFEGQSQYTLKRMIRFANAAIVSFSTKPLLIGIWLGLITSTLAFAELVYIVVKFLTGFTVPGWASTVGIMALLFGVLFVLLGVIGLYLSRIHTALQERPKFVIQTICSTHLTDGTSENTPAMTKTM